jgi:hypothetical protein
MQTVACVLPLRAAAVDACKTDDVASSMQIIELSGVEFILRPFLLRFGLHFEAHDQIFILILSLVTIALLFFL